MNKFQEKIQEFSKNRIFLLLCSITVLFSILIFRLFLLQIIHGEEYEQKLTTSILREVKLPASRGTIYDRYGRPLAVNHVAYSIQIDNSITLDLSGYKPKLVMDFIEYMKQKNMILTDTLPISNTKPYTFTFKTLQEEQDWKQQHGIPKNMIECSAEEVLTYFENELAIPSHFSEEEKRSAISFYTSVDDRNIMVLSLLKILDQNNETLVDDLPITQQQPYNFLFNDNKGKELSWKTTVDMKTEQQQAYDATQTIDYLQNYFDIPKELPSDIVRKAIGIRYAMFLERFYRYQPVTISLDVSTKTLANVEEMNDIFPCITVGTDSLRDYPMGKYFAHIIGYTRKMTDTNYDIYKDDVDEEGNKIYSMTDVVGQSGIESIFERELNGKDGKMVVEVDNVGRRMNTIESQNPVSGQDIFLTLDSRLQKSAYDALENVLRDVIKRKLNGGGTTLQELFSRMLSDNSISIDKICNATEGEQYILYQKILEQDTAFELTELTEEERKAGKVNPRDFALQVLTSAIDKGEITPRQLILVLIEQGKISADAEYLASIQNGIISPLQVINDKLDSGELTPGDTNLDPCTGSVVISRVDSGEVLSSVTYPSYDTNEFSNNFNNSYYIDLMHRKDTTPLVNRPMSERKAPGSTFKMIPALAGLETGVIAPNSTINDLGYFTKAGKPYPKCWIYGSSGGRHGAVNVAHALEVSCNYFFYELAYRMGNASEKTTAQGIATLNEYMAAFGLNDYTGVEIGESSPMMATPANKERSIRAINPNASESQVQWTDADSIRTYIGQSVNNYAPIHMTKYIATLANGGTRYKMHMVSKLVNADGTTAQQFDEIVENILELQQQNLDIVYQGMLLVTSGQRGTLRAIFNNFPIQVAAKSGTAEEDKSRSSHSWFVCFAPYDDPQIAITVLLPYGEISGAPAAVIAREIIRDYMGLNYEPENHYMENILAE